MSTEFCNFDSLTNAQQTEVAQLVSAYTSGQLGEAPQMLPLQPSDIVQKRLGFVALDNDSFAGYVGATQPVEHNGLAMTEVGSLWVPASHRKQGIAHELVSLISKQADALDIKAYAFCNPLSLKIFEQRGYVQATPDEIPAIAFGACATCPMQSKLRHCCDIMVVYEGMS